MAMSWWCLRSKWMVHRHRHPAQAAVLDIGAVGDLVVAVKLESNVRPIELKSLQKILARRVSAPKTRGAQPAWTEFRPITQLDSPAGR
jgi:hypothetical protein